MVTAHYGFRLPFGMSERSLLGIDEPEFELDNDGEVCVILRSTVVDQPLSDAQSLVVRGSGYESEHRAAEEGERWRDVISRALARVHLGADFGDRRAYGQFTEAGLVLISAQAGVPVLSDVPGVTVFPHPDTIFMRSEAKGCRRPTPEQTKQVLRSSVESSSPLREEERLAFDLFSGSFFQPSADARLLMLTMSVETLLKPRPRSKAAQEHVTSLIKETQVASLSPAERASLEGSLKWLVTESIGQAGRQLARTLEPRRYMGLTPAAFFTRAYEMRSALVHGRVPRPSRLEVDLLAANLEVFVGHVLSGELLTVVDD